MSEIVCQRLPREIRDLIYGFILDYTTLHRVHDCAFPYGVRGTQPIAITHDLDLKYWPVLLVPGAVKETFRTELVEYFRKVDPFLCIENGHGLEALLAKDLLRTNIRHADRALYSLGIKVSFPNSLNGTWDAEVLLSNMLPIVKGHQELANNFTLKLNILAMIYPPEHLSDPFYNFHLSRSLEKWALGLRKSWPTLRKIQEVIEKEGTARKMNIIMSMQPTGPDSGPRFSIRLQEKMVEFDGDGWRDFIKPLLKKRHGIK